MYGDPRINEATEYLKNRLGGLPLDGKHNEGRRYCHLLLKALEKEFPSSDPLKLLTRLIDVAHGSECRTYATNFAWLYRNKSMLITMGKAQKARASRPPEDHRAYKIIKKQ